MKTIINHLRSIQSLFEREYRSGKVDEYEPMEIASTIQRAADLLEWKPLSTAPRDRTHVELRGNSGYNGHPYRVMIARYEPERENPNWTQQFNDPRCWRTVAGDHVTDDGEMPTHWRPVS